MDGSHWQLASLHLVRVLRLPQEGSVEGLPVGLAISPDGQTIAVEAGRA
ncbi:MAG: hypothetical protein JWQ73_867 [Variovorax sp.]|nr:hypothetical protein [Variovorax sp.]